MPRSVTVEHRSRRSRGAEAGPSRIAHSVKRKILIGLAVVLALLAGGAAAIYAFLSGDAIRAAIEAQATAALGRPVTIGRATPAFFPRVSLDLRDVVVGAKREVVVQRVLVSTGVRGLISRRVEDASVAIEHSTIDIPWAWALLDALGQSSSAAPAGPAASQPSAPLSIESIGSITLNDIVLSAGTRKLVVDLQASLNGDTLVIQRMQGRSPETEFTATGSIASLTTRTGSLTIDAARLDLDGLMTFLVAATPAGARDLPPSTPNASPPPPASDPSSMDLQIGVRAARGQVLGLALANVTTAARVRGGTVTLDNLKMDVLGGRYDGSAAFVDARGVGRYEWRGEFTGLDVPQIMTFAGASGALTGRLSGTVAVNAAGTDPQQAMQRARGTSRLTIADGRIPGLEVVRSVVLAFGKPTGDRPAGSGEAFTRLAATVAIDGMNLSTGDLVFESRDFDMNGEGRVSLVTKAVDFTTSVVLSKELSAQAGRDLYRLAREGERVVLPARITGSINAPNVMIDVKAALGRALRNKAEEQIKGLFDRFRRK
jgi:uncharacterized protein involved in outer membrane biogenesis